jgi:hypothetical protein
MDRAGKFVPQSPVDPPLRVQRHEPLKIAHECGPCSQACPPVQLRRLKIPFVCIGRIERDPQEDEARIIVANACFGAADPADCAMNTQADNLGKPTPYVTLLLLQNAMVEILLQSLPSSSGL